MRNLIHAVTHPAFSTLEFALLFAISFFVRTGHRLVDFACVIVALAVVVGVNTILHRVTTTEAHPT